MYSVNYCSQMSVKIFPMTNLSIFLSLSLSLFPEIQVERYIEPQVINVNHHYIVSQEPNSRRPEASEDSQILSRCTSILFLVLIAMIIITLLGCFFENLEDLLNDVIMFILNYIW